MKKLFNISFSLFVIFVLFSFIKVDALTYSSGSYTLDYRLSGSPEVNTVTNNASNCSGNTCVFVSGTYQFTSWYKQFVSVFSYNDAIPNNLQSLSYDFNYNLQFYNTQNLPVWNNDLVGLNIVPNNVQLSNYSCSNTFNRIEGETYCTYNITGHCTIDYSNSSNSTSEFIATLYSKDQTNKPTTAPLLVYPSNFFSNIYVTSTSSISNVSFVKDPLSQSVTNIDNEIKETNKKVDKINEDIKKNHEEAEKTRKGILQTILDLPGKLLDMLIGLFVPDNFDFLNDFKDSLSNKLGFIAAVPIKLTDFLFGLATAEFTELDSVNFPSISIFGIKFWDNLDIDLSFAINILKPIKYITDVLCVSLCCVRLKKLYHRFFGDDAS